MVLDAGSRSLRTIAVGLCVALASIAVIAVPTAAGAAAPAGRIVTRGAATSVAYAADSTRRIALSVPLGAASGDLLLASIGVGRNSTRSQVTISAPAGWTLVSRTNLSSVATLALYRHVLAAGESSYSWTTDVAVGGTAFLAAFSGVDPTNPIDASQGTVVGRTTTVGAPSVTTTTSDSTLVASYAGYRGADVRTTWTSPAGMSEIGDASVPGGGNRRGDSSGGSRTGSVHVGTQASPGPSGTKTATASTTQDYALGVLTALRPAPATPPPPPPPTAGPVPLIIDTDIFSDADDVGALATAFALQAKGEAKVVAIGVNTRTSRPAVATSSWRCVAAVAQFYGSPSVPIGTASPNNGADVNTPNFTGPCGALASPSTPTPDTAVNVMRRALIAQPDGSAVIVSTGYFGNLAALLASPADAISPLSGRDLITKKVRRLVSMAGGYPSRGGETNLVGDPQSAQAVASSWPTELVWSGYEVGDAIHTGSTITRTHPSSSPVRTAYEAFAGPNNWIYSYDLTAVYHAVRPADAVMTRVGPGTNVVDANGGNAFSNGTGNQYYLKLADAATLTANLDGLLSYVPPSGPGPPPPPPPAAGASDNFDTNTLDPARWTVVPSSSTIGVANQELQITHAPGSWTSGAVQSAAVYDQTGKSVQLQLKRAANDGLGGSTFGETSAFLWIDATHYVSFFVASGTLTARVNQGSGEVNLNPSWPAYSASAMQWLRFREAGGTLYWEYASGATAPGAWTVLASAPNPFSMQSVVLRIAAGSNTGIADVTRVDNIATS
ncbi:MAG: hypothetical protein JWN46_4015 [Acidimicrobiales bacterium]|nr:hypothetical protein [Acidimicrobiales bacterium]